MRARRGACRNALSVNVFRSQTPTSGSHFASHFGSGFGAIGYHSIAYKHGVTYWARIRTHSIVLVLVNVRFAGMSARRQATHATYTVRRAASDPPRDRSHPERVQTGYLYRYLHPCVYRGLPQYEVPVQGTRPPSRSRFHTTRSSVHGRAAAGRAGGPWRFVWRVGRDVW